MSMSSTGGCWRTEERVDKEPEEDLREGLGAGLGRVLRDLGLDREELRDLGLGGRELRDLDLRVLVPDF